MRHARSETGMISERGSTQRIGREIHIQQPNYKHTSVT